MTIPVDFLEQAALRLVGGEGERGGFVFVDEVAEANPYHDQRGRFAAKGGIAPVDALEMYANGGGGSDKLNMYLVFAHGDLSMVEKADPQIAARVRAMDAAFRDPAIAETLDKPMRVYRGTADGFWVGSQPGTRTLNPAFLSTSERERTASLFPVEPGYGVSKTVIAIDAPAGTRAINMAKATGSGSLNTRESEWLFPRNSTLVYKGDVGGTPTFALETSLTEANPYHDQRGRFTTRGGGGHSPALDAKLDEIEGQIRGRDGGEAIFVLSPNGDVIETNTGIGNAAGAAGAVASVSLSGSAEKYAGAIVTHNHPLMGDSKAELRKYDTFSPDDIRSAIGMNLSEARMVNVTGTHVLKPGPNGWGTQRQFADAARRVLDQKDYFDHVGGHNYIKRIDLTRDLAKEMGWQFEVIPQ